MSKDLKLKRVVIKEEFVELTGNYKLALVLNQLLYWTERVGPKRYNLFAKEERKRNINDTTNLKGGWVYKKAEEIAAELMMGITPETARNWLKELENQGYILSRKNPKEKWDHTKQYRVNLLKIQSDLQDLGFNLEGYINIFEKREKPLRSPKSPNRNNLGSKQNNYDSNLNNYDTIPEITSENTNRDYKKQAATHAKKKNSNPPVNEKDGPENNNSNNAAGQPDIYNFIDSKTDHLFTETFGKDITLKQAKQLSRYDQKYIVAAFKELQSRNTGSINAPVKYMRPVIKDFKSGQKKIRQSKNDQLREIYQEAEDDKNLIDDDMKEFYENNKDFYNQFNDFEDNEISKYDKGFNSNKEVEVVEEQKESNKLKGFELVEDGFLGEEGQRKYYKLTGENITEKQLKLLENNYEYLEAFNELNDKYYFFKDQDSNLSFNIIFERNNKLKEVN